MSNEQDNQHLQELASYRFTVENLRARVAELESIAKHSDSLAFELECMLIAPDEHWDSAAKALDAYKQAQCTIPSPFATDVPVPPERKAIYAALRARRATQAAKATP